MFLYREADIKLQKWEIIENEQFSLFFRHYFSLNDKIDIFCSFFFLQMESFFNEFKNGENQFQMELFLISNSCSEENILLSGILNFLFFYNFFIKVIF